jgi:hypothetical protein
MGHVSKRRTLFPYRTEGKVLQSGQIISRNLMRLSTHLRLSTRLRRDYRRQYADGFGGHF